MQRKLGLLLLLSGLAACSAAGNVSQSQSALRDRAAPTLVVVITIDQFRGDYIDRFRPQLTGGIARLADGGAWFTNAHHDHANTETAPGHASLLTGRFPRSTGISSNSAGVGDPSFPLISGYPNEPGASPYRLKGTTLVDWILRSDPGSRALSISMKDRAAILPVGHSQQNVFWYSGMGNFTTSTYYAKELPAWLQKFNARDIPRKSAGQVWTLLLPESAYPEPDSVPRERGGIDFTFPHVMAADSAQAASLFRATPGMDDITLAAALEGVNALGIGGGQHLDVLNISLSATDVVGHTYGPDSRELHDQFLRVDRLLGAFMDSLYKLRDSTKIIFAMTGDHGVGSMPELNVERAVPPPVRTSLAPVAVSTRARLRALGVDTLAITFDGFAVSADRNAFRTARVNADSILFSLASELRNLAGVLRVDRFADLMKADTVADPIARRWLHQFPSDGDVELLVTLTRMSIATTTAAQHGSPHDYDSHVPIIFFGKPFKHATFAEFVRTVDIAPTLAAALGVKPLEKLDGRVLVRAMK